MAPKRIEMGWTGETVMHNLPRYRGLRHMKLTDLSEKLAELGRPMSVPTLSAIENGKRRIDVDDLVHLALALDVTPSALMMPEVERAHELPDAPGSVAWTDAHDWWAWLVGRNPLWASPNTDLHDLETWRRSVNPSWTWKTTSNG
ncbi:helix-turn-helix domain-containing protein [Mycobacteroides abscessus]|uniref:helix-turn-helix domain-containing protein n=1 Tax=Mycobacteroides abscessus TaxID=36809 RepID=UPI001C71D4D6|nr:helix-turn-helix transcriptional regulator [Mycobacteroides abscessus]